ncbi:hypothetical protein [Nocardioides caricicola]|uniref:AMP-binding enzyme C-terminal domain-containing protein n=1 Tax=Nocardioides caricicola TaxID=634770 RepID=A0ABW0N469_9ACTN
MTVQLVWLSDAAQVDVVVRAPGPWRELVEAGPGLLVAETDETVSRVYHEVKAMLPEDCALVVAPLQHRPKARGLSEGTVSWLRARLPLPDRE